jgi:hypothetical protein
VLDAPGHTQVAFQVGFIEPDGVYAIDSLPLKRGLLLVAAGSNYVGSMDVARIEASGLEQPMGEVLFGPQSRAELSIEVTPGFYAIRIHNHGEEPCAFFLDAILVRDEEDRHK